MNVNPFSYIVEKLKGYVSKSGDTMTGTLNIEATNDTPLTLKRTNSSSSVMMNFYNQNGIVGGYVAGNDGKPYYRKSDGTYPQIALMSDITWNYLGVINGSLPLPSSFNELFIRCDFEKAKIYSVLNIPKLSLEATERTYGSGNYALSNVNYGFEVYVSTTSIRTNWIFKNNGDIKSTSEIAVYYR